MREPRELAVQALYEADTLGLSEVAGHLTGKAERLAVGTLGELDRIDSLLGNASENWPVDRMPAVDRAILRLAVHELLSEPETPTAVVIAEAVRIAKVFSTEKSGKFVNGVLGGLALRVRTER